MGLVAASAVLIAASVGVPPGPATRVAAAVQATSMASPVSVSVRAVALGVAVRWGLGRGAKPVRFTVTTRPRSTTVQLGRAARSAELVGLTAGVAYRVVLAAVGSGGSRSVTSAAVRPAAPGGLLQLTSPVVLADTRGPTRARIMVSLPHVPASAAAALVRLVVTGATLPVSVRSGATLLATAAKRGSADTTTVVAPGRDGRLPLTITGKAQVRVLLLGWVTDAHTGAGSAGSIVVTPGVKLFPLDRASGTFTSGQTVRVRPLAERSLPASAKAAWVSVTVIAAAHPTVVTLTGADGGPLTLTAASRQSVTQTTLVLVTAAGLRVQASAAATVSVVATSYVTNGTLSSAAGYLTTVRPWTLLQSASAHLAARAFRVGGRGGVPAATATVPATGVLVRLLARAAPGIAQAAAGASLLGAQLASPLLASGPGQTAVTTVVVPVDADGDAFLSFQGPVTVTVLGFVSGDLLRNPADRTLTVAELAGASKSGSSLTLPRLPAGVRVGSILVAGASGGVPSGLLDRVSGLSRSANGVWQIALSPVQIADAYPRLALSYTIPIGAPQPAAPTVESRVFFPRVAGRPASVVHLQGDATLPTLSIDLGVNDPKVTGLKLSGGLRATAAVSGYVVSDVTTVHPWVHVMAQTTLSLDEDIFLAGAFSVGVSAQVNLAEATIDKWLGKSVEIPLGETGLAVSPHVSVPFTFSSTANQDATFTAHTHQSLTVGADLYLSPGKKTFTPILGATATATASPPDVTTTGEQKVSLGFGMGLELHPDGLDDAEIHVDLGPAAYLKYVAGSQSCDNQQFWGIVSGVDAELSAGVGFGPFSFDVPVASQSLFGPDDIGHPTNNSKPVVISPANPTVAPGGTQQLDATCGDAVNDVGEREVTWAVDTAGGGTITDTGLYTAPNAPGVYTVTAHRDPDPGTGRAGGTASATVIVSSTNGNPPGGGPPGGPTPPPTSPHDTAALTAGTYHTCALKNAGNIDCWGGNYSGELGDAATAGGQSDIPVPVAGVTGAQQVSAAAYHTCALLAGGKVACWGANGKGELGNGSVDSAGDSEPAPQTVVGLTGATAVAAGGAVDNGYDADYSCAVVSGGDVKCWGDLYLAGPTPTPTPVAGVADAVQLAASPTSTCALLATRTVVCWGDNAYGELGDPAAGSSSAAAVPVTGLTGVVSISSGADNSLFPGNRDLLGHNDGYTCALLDSGTVDCWGSNVSGELGDSTTTNRSSPTPVPGLSGVAAIAAGINHTCAVLNVGTVKCWGDNAAGAIGDGTTINRLAPTAVLGVSAATAVSAGYNTCVRLTTSGVDCWGDNQVGELGDGTTTSRSTAAPVTGE